FWVAADEVVMLAGQDLLAGNLWLGVRPDQPHTDYVRAQERSTWKRRRGAGRFVRALAGRPLNVNDRSRGRQEKSEAASPRQELDLSRGLSGVGLKVQRQGSRGHPGT